ncbi:phage virion morphogenesis protein [Mameliella sp. CS4]|uniref:phage virion morphogenesis protein n=1 Tax=Mameliella sp. CS4 TaxID=2862329 RepID=UPI001C5E3F88|nr:phage virion morphogenesis protein [Mameliella sp. CS4]MBW4984746.1 phage virion morphogenesis protein [Mameliella sp. CS4]
MITVDVTTDTLRPALAEAEQALSDLTPLLQDIGELMVERTKGNFKTGTAPDGTAWAPRSQATLDAYAARGDTPKGGPLVGVTRALSTTIAYEVAPGHVDWGSNMIYAAVMQFGAAQGQFGTTSRGASIPWGDIPARPFVGIGPEGESAILKTIEDYLQDLIDD